MAPRKQTPAQQPSTATEFAQAILTIRNRPVVIAADLARFYGVETRVLNQAVSRHPNKFPPHFMFELTAGEKQQVITNCDHLQNLKYSGSPLKAFSEHGVLMAASVLRSDRADEISVALVNAFIQLRELHLAQRSCEQDNKGKHLIDAMQTPCPSDTPLAERLDNFLATLAPKIEQAMASVLDTVIHPRNGTTLRQEAEDFLAESIDHLKSRLQKTGLENEEIAARITKMLAEADHKRQQARYEKANAEEKELTQMIRRLRLILSAQKLLTPDTLNESDPILQRMNQFEKTLQEIMPPYTPKT